MYFLDKMLPKLNMEDKFRFTVEQMTWVEENEASIWEYFIEEDLLFSKKEIEFRSFLNYAPFAKGMPNLIYFKHILKLFFYKKFA